MSVGIVDKSTGERIQTAGNPLDKVGDLTNLITTAKDNAVAAINEVNAGLAGKQNTLTFDDAPTDGSNNPVKSNGIYDAMALKQNATDNSLQTTDKTVVGAVNELKSGLTNVNSDIANLKLNNFSMDSNDIKDYNTSANKYTFQTDGYLCATTTNDDIIVNIFGSLNNYVMLAPRLNNNSAVYVRKGMRCYVATNTGSNPVYFVGLI